MQQLSLVRAPVRQAGFTLLELLFVLALSVTVASVAIPSAGDAIDAMRTATAARYLSARLTDARLKAIAGSASVGLRFEAAGLDYRFAAYRDGNGNGVRSTEIAAGVDTPLGLTERLADKFPGVVVGLLPGYPDADAVPGTGTDGLRIGTPRIATMSPDGTATPGTVYLHGRHTQFAVRVLGTTGRVRVLEYRQAGGTWVTR